MDEYGWIAEVSQYASEAERLRARVKVLEEALRPFTLNYKLPKGAESDPIFEDFERARKVLEEGR